MNKTVPARLHFNTLIISSNHKRLHFGTLAGCLLKQDYPSFPPHSRTKWPITVECARLCMHHLQSHLHRCMRTHFRALQSVHSLATAKRANQCLTHSEKKLHRKNASPPRYLETIRFASFANTHGCLQRRWVKLYARQCSYQVMFIYNNYQRISYRKETDRQLDGQLHPLVTLLRATPVVAVTVCRHVLKLCELQLNAKQKHTKNNKPPVLWRCFDVWVPLCLCSVWPHDVFVQITSFVVPAVTRPIANEFLKETRRKPFYYHKGYNSLCMYHFKTHGTFYFFIKNARKAGL